jgi:hypothetical protein
MQGVFLVITMSVILANLLADFLYGWLDPRIKARVTFGRGKLGNIDIQVALIFTESGNSGAFWKMRATNLETISSKKS